MSDEHQRLAPPDLQSSSSASPPESNRGRVCGALTWTLVPGSGVLGPILEPQRKGRFEQAPHLAGCLPLTPPNIHGPVDVSSCTPPPSPPCREPPPFHASQSLQTASSIMFPLINF